MKNTFFIKVALSLFLLAGFSTISRSQTMSSSTVGLAWARNTVNVPVFRKNSVVSFHNLQYTAYYDADGYMVIAKRELSSSTWEVQRTKFKGTVTDAHRSISIMVDGDGFLHISWDHHGNALRYCRSVCPESLELTNEMPMVGTLEGNVTYPEFHKLINGDILFFYRDGSSGSGNLVINRYDLASRKWSRVQSNLIDGQSSRNAYWQSCVDTKGTLHLSWVFRESSDVSTNHDMYYARSFDGGVTWEKSTGEKYALPINLSTSEKVCSIAQSSDLINQTSMYADSQGRPYIASYWTSSPVASNITQYRIIYYTGTEWKTTPVTARTTAFSLAGSGTKAIPISRPQIIIDDSGSKIKGHIIFRDVERGYKVSMSTCEDISTNVWTTSDLTNYSVNFWEPSFDTELWKTSKKLHIFVQNATQGDGEQLGTMDPQPVTILEWTPAKK